MIDGLEISVSEKRRIPQAFIADAVCGCGAKGSFICGGTCVCPECDINATPIIMDGNDCDEDSEPFQC